MSKTQKQNFINGAVILMVAGLLVKVIGAIFKIPLGNLLGPEGMSYFTAGYDIYTWMYILATAGLPVAVSKLVAENNARGNYQEADKILKVSFRAFGLVGLAGSLILLVGAVPLSNLVSNPMAVYCIVAIAPAIIFESITSTYRGYFQGNQNMIPTAISQTIVAVAKLVIGFGLAWYLQEMGFSLPIVAAGAIAGVTVGTVLSSLYLFIRNRRDRDRQVLRRRDTSPLNTTQGQIAKKLFAIAIPVTIGSSVLSITNLLDLAVVMNRLLASGMDDSMAKTVYGAYSGYSRTLFQMPTSLIVSLGISLIPALAARLAAGERREGINLIDQTIRLTMLFGLPAAFGMAMLSHPILSLLYASQPEGVDIAAPLLTALGPAIIFVCLVSITNNILQGIGKQNIPVYAMLVGGALKLFINYTLVAVPEINIHAAPFGTNVCYGVITVINLVFICKYTGYVPRLWSTILKPLIAAAACGGAGLLSYNLLEGLVGGKLGVMVAICLAVLVYLVLVFVLHIVTREDLEMIPGGKKLLKVLGKFGYQS